MHPTKWVQLLAHAQRDKEIKRERGRDRTSERIGRVFGRSNRSKVSRCKFGTNMPFTFLTPHPSWPQRRFLAAAAAATVAAQMHLMQGMTVCMWPSICIHSLLRATEQTVGDGRWSALFSLPLHPCHLPCPLDFIKIKRNYIK